MVSAVTVPSMLWPMPVSVTTAPFEPAWPQLLASLPWAVSRAFEALSKSSTVFLSTTDALVLVR